MLFATRSAFSRVVGTALTGMGVFLWAGGAPGASTAGPAPATQTLRLYYTPPVVVRSGERVVMPVDVVCATDEGDACEADVEIGTQVGGESWRSSRPYGVLPLAVDLSGPASQAAPTGVVRFFLRASDGAGRVAALGAARSDASLRFYVTDQMPTVRMPEIQFGQTRAGETVLSLPWGSGALRAGLELGNESDTFGPTSFDVDGDGRLYLLDALQRRLAIFAGGVLTREATLPDEMHVDLAAGEDGSAFVLTRSGPALSVRQVDAAGSIGPPASLGEGLGAHLDTMGADAFADLLPLDAWVAVPRPGGSLSASPPIQVGRPVSAHSEILRIARPDSIRLATLTLGTVTDAVELQSTQALGEVELADADGDGGYWVVVRVWQDGQEPAGQYQVVHVHGDVVLDSFAVADREFATVPPLNRFRLAGGYLYQMTTSPEGTHIVRYHLGGAA
jgi:hypothetical protein